jgi:capsule polysaccharide export protein KpsE/RkpR
VHADLQTAEKALGQFSSTNATLDIKEQTHAMVDAAARLQAELIVGQSELDSLQQIYGEGNVRVRAARARIGLAVPWADLYRRVRIQETVFELLSQQYEMARIEEAKDTPVVAVIDEPLVAEKKSFPPRLLMILLLTMLAVGAASFYIILNSMWEHMSPSDPRKVLVREMIK